MKQRLSEKYRPRTLSDIVGQPAVRVLQRFVEDPYPTCFLLEGATGGTGKTSAALALANDMGCDDEWSGRWLVNAVDLSIDFLRDLFDHKLRLRPLSGSGWNVLIIEELEAVPSVQVERAMKTYLEMKLHNMRCVVVATSNGAGGLSKPLLQRFTPLCFAGGPGLRRAGQERIAQIWAKETGGREMPAGWLNWGLSDDVDFSLRVAMNDMETSLIATHVEVAIR